MVNSGKEKVRVHLNVVPRSTENTLPRVVPCFPLLGLTPSGLFMGLSSTIIYTSELILCSTICVLSATRHNIQMYPYFLKLNLVSQCTMDFSMQLKTNGKFRLLVDRVKHRNGTGMTM